MQKMGLNSIKSSGLFFFFFSVLSIVFYIHFSPKFS